MKLPIPRSVGSIAVLATLLLAGTAVHVGGTASAGKADPFLTNIKHIIFVVMENHAYDNLFGGYCLTYGPSCSSTANGAVAGSCADLSTGQCISPWLLGPQNESISGKMPHSQNASLAAWNNGSMNGFYQAEQSGLNPFGYYGPREVPIYWDIAQHYSLDDNFYSSSLSYSLPNHWHIVAGQAPQQIVGNYTTVRGIGGTAKAVAADHKYLNQANGTRSIEDLLLNSSVSWKYYDYTLGSYAQAIQVNAQKTGSAYSYWNPQAAKAESYNASFTQHFVSNNAYFADAHNGTLPELSWVIPSASYSDHPPASVAAAQGYVASLVDALEASPEWSSSLMFITWDDYGGFYDHVAPPDYNGMQLSFRVPLLVVGPYVRENYVSPSLGYFESILRLMEWRFGLGCLTPMDCGAPIAMDYLQFSHARAPILFPDSVSTASYPLRLSTTQTVTTGSYQPSSAYSTFLNQPDTD
jgi:phospholipase C